MNKLMNRILLVATFIFISTSAYSMTIGEEEFTCPIDNHKFTASVNYSGTRLGMRLDLKPLGPIAAPWLLPVCPQCGFPQFKQEFSEEELVRYRSYVLSEKYQAYVHSHPSYFLLAKINEFDDKPSNQIAYNYIQASWQVEDRNREQYKQYLSLALEKYKAFLASAKERNDQTVTAELMVGELLRQLGNFDAALTHFKKLAEKDIEKEIIKLIIKQEIELCRKNDSAPHPIEHAESP